jgi:hypothetical protein
VPLLAVKQFADYFHKSPELLGSEDVRRFQLYLLNEKKLTPATVKIRMSALRFFHWKTLNASRPDLQGHGVSEDGRKIAGRVEP